MKKFTSEECESFIERPDSPFFLTKQNHSTSFTFTQDNSIKPLTKKDRSITMNLSPETFRQKDEENPQFNFEKQCHVCQKKFGVLSNRHHCRWCGHSICKEHSLKTRPKRENNKIKAVRICDDCDILIVQNNMNLNLALDNEILRKKIDKLQFQLKQRDQNLIEVNMKLQDMQSNLNIKENDEISKEQSLKKLLQEEQMKHEYTRNATESLRIALEQSQKSEKIAEDLNKRYKAELEHYSKNIQILNQETQQLKINNEKLIFEVKFYEKKLSDKENSNAEQNSLQKSIMEQSEQEQSNQNQEKTNLDEQQEYKNLSFKDSVLNSQYKQNNKGMKAKHLKTKACNCLIM